MEFIKLESRGGNYLVVAQNIAWLRTAENGQTSVGIVGGQPLLVVGSIEEVAEKILAAAAVSAHAEQPVPQQASPPPVAQPTILPDAASEPTTAIAAAVTAPEPTPERTPAPTPEPITELAPASAAPEPVSEAVAQSAPKAPAPERPHAKSRFSSTLADRIARAGAPTVKAGSQRLMTMSE